MNEPPEHVCKRFFTGLIQSPTLVMKADVLLFIDSVSLRLVQKTALLGQAISRWLTNTCYGNGHTKERITSTKKGSVTLSRRSCARWLYRFSASNSLRSLDSTSQTWNVLRVWASTQPAPTCSAHTSAPKSLRRALHSCCHKTCPSTFQELQDINILGMDEPMKKRPLAARARRIQFFCHKTSTLRTIITASSCVQRWNCSYFKEILMAKLHHLPEDRGRSIEDVIAKGKMGF